MLEKSKTLITIVLILIHTTNITASCSLHNVAEVLASLWQHYSCGDVIQIVSSLSGEKEASQISKHLSRFSVPTSVISTQTIQKTIPKFENSSTHIFFVQQDSSSFIDNHFSNTYKKLSKRKPKWVFFPEENDTIDLLFEGVDLPFNSEILVARPGNFDQVTLTEVYRIAANQPLKVSFFGSWTQSGGLMAPDLGLYNRRNSLEGFPIRSTNVHDPPLSHLSTGTNKSIVLGGFCGRVWSIFESHMNFRSQHIVPSIMTGNPWQDMMEALVKDEADVTSSYMAQTTPRTFHNAFSFPLAMIPFRVFIESPEGLHGKWESLVNPLSYSLWFTITMFILVFTLILYLGGRFIEGTTRTSFEDALFLAFSVIICHVGRDCSSHRIGCQITFQLMHSLGIIVSASYGAALLSNLAIIRTSLPFRSMTDINAQTVFQLGTVNMSIVHMRFMNSKVGVLKKLANKYFMNPENTPTTHLEGFQRACRMPFAFISLSESLSRIRDDLNCSIIALPQHFMKFSAGLAFPLNSPYRGLFNHNLLKLISGGILRHLHHAILNEPLPTPPADAVPIDIITIRPILAVLSFGITIAVVQLLVGRVALAWKRWKAPAKGARMRRSFRL